MTNETEIITKNSDLLFIYDAEMCNPNGDPDNENKPRMDVNNSINLVTDVRLKRYIRDYLETYSNQEIYLTNPEGIILNATDRLKFWVWRTQNPTAEFETTKLTQVKLELTSTEILDGFIDVRIFGATIPIKPKDVKAKGSSITFTGPVQFCWGKSLNKVELVESSTITTHLASGKRTQESTAEDQEQHGSMGQDFRLYYSLIAFYGIISAKRAQITRMTKADLKLFEESVMKSIPLLATRSKIGQYPRLYLRIQYKDDSYFMGDLRKYIKLNQVDGLRGISDVVLDVNDLFNKIKANKDKIEKIYYWKDEQLTIEGTFPPTDNEVNGLFEELEF